MIKNKFLLSSIMLLTLSISSCKNEPATPKPRGYFRIDLPQKEYQQYNSTCPYTFEYSKYANISADPYFPNKKCWININYPGINGKIHISYKKLNNNLSKFTEESRELAYKHTIKAESINEKIFLKPGRSVYGTLYNIKGNTASSVQFYLTDSTNHFLRGALYFNVQPNKDSLAPVINFVKEDITVLIESFKWK
ncbi:MAG: gliding motility lipoprotein GldD [Bacteroidota bacterium]|nr:gliding motility lipoprotein GldD [Bacteroidota bacterium]